MSAGHCRRMPVQPSQPRLHPRKGSTRLQSCSKHSGLVLMIGYRLLCRHARPGPPPHNPRMAGSFMTVAGTCWDSGWGAPKRQLAGCWLVVLSTTPHTHAAQTYKQQRTLVDDWLASELELSRLANLLGGWRCSKRLSRADCGGLVICTERSWRDSLVSHKDCNKQSRVLAGDPECGRTSWRAAPSTLAAAGAVQAIEAPHGGMAAASAAPACLRRREGPRAVTFSVANTPRD